MEYIRPQNSLKQVPVKTVTHELCFSDEITIYCMPDACQHWRRCYMDKANATPRSCKVTADVIQGHPKSASLLDSGQPWKPHYDVPQKALWSLVLCRTIWPRTWTADKRSRTIVPTESTQTMTLAHTKHLLQAHNTERDFLLATFTSSACHRQKVVWTWMHR